MGLFQQARDRVVAFGAPAPEGNIEQCWQALTAWAQAEAEARKAQMATAQQKLTEAETGRQQLQEGQLALCLAGGVEVRGASTRDAARAALVRAEERLHAIDESIGRRQTVERELDERSKAAATAKLLGTHLRADHFEAWYLQEVMQRLVNGATERMQDLSAGQYSLTLSDKGNDFFVIDHINANEQRPVRTLSGGETFLASLALALALGDDIASLAAKGASRLDALFLDEGFGSLDQNTLETVATTIEELGARGRMVGIITHVQELADRVPVQFRVNKINGTSRVERMQAG